MSNVRIFFVQPFLKYYELFSRFALSISLAAAGIGAISSFVLFHTIQFSSVVLPFLATLFVYNLDRIAEPSESDMISNPERTLFVRKYRPVYISIVALSFVLLVVLSLLQGWNVFFTVLLFPVFSVLYVVPFLPFKKVRRIKEIPGVKAVYVNLCWCTLVLLTVVIEDKPVEIPLLVFVVSFVFLRLFVGGVLGDLRDRKGDEVAGVRTLAVILGERKTVKLIEALHLVSIVGTVLFILLYSLPVYLFGMVISCFIGYYFHVKIKQQHFAPGVYFDLFDAEYYLYIVWVWILRVVSG